MPARNLIQAVSDLVLELPPACSLLFLHMEKMSQGMWHRFSECQWVMAGAWEGKAGGAELGETGM